jgi:formate-dependent nitrite reductase cytochrome c552 subunit
LQYTVVHEYEMSKHAQKGVNCLDCHQPVAGQEKEDHHDFVIAKGHLTAANCRGCHEQIYQQFLRSRIAPYNFQPLPAQILNKKRNLGSVLLQPSSNQRAVCPYASVMT